MLQLYVYFNYNRYILNLETDRAFIKMLFNQLIIQNNIKVKYRQFELSQFMKFSKSNLIQFYE